MQRLSIDIETFSDLDLKDVGVHKYVESPVFSILLFAYAYDDGEINVISLAENEKLPQKVLENLNNPDIIKSAFNATFEMCCIRKHFNINLDPKEWECTLVHASYLGLGGTLAKTAEILNLDVSKDKAGTALINYFSKPCKPTKTNIERVRNLPEHNMEKWEMFKSYCKTDVEVERAIKNKIEKIYTVNDFEKQLWELDYEINNNGVGLNVDFINNAIECNTILTNQTKQSVRDLTGIENPKSYTQIKEWLSNQENTTITSVSKEALKDVIPNLKSEKSKRFFKLQVELNKTSISKYSSMINRACQDNNVRGILQFYGASRTGRWAGRGIQVHNLPRNYMRDLNEARNFVINHNYDALEILYPSVSGVLSELIRTALEATKGYKFVISDFSAIEARIIAWLSDEKWRIDIFASHGKIYEASASQMFNVPIEEITKGSDLRSKGKVAELALGYQGGVGALKRMGAETMGLSEEEMTNLVIAWRKANPNISKLWGRVQKAAIDTVKTKGFIVLGKLKFYYKNSSLFIRLPSDRELCYLNATLELDVKNREKLIFTGINQTTKNYERQDTYGGKLVENVVQAIARDCLAVTLKRVAEKGYKIVMHIHDEIVVEVPESNTGDLDVLNNIFREPIEWADGLSLKGEGFETRYYMKD